MVRLDAERGARRRRAARGARDPHDPPARRELARRRRRSTIAGRRAGGRRARALDARSRGRRCCAPRDGGAEVELLAAEDGVSPGQACVIYDERRAARPRARRRHDRARRRARPGLALRPPEAPRRREHTNAERHRRTALMRKAYARWAPIYDLVYDKLTEPAARAAVEAAMACGPRILEAGVGTGLALGYYRPGVEVHGVDLSEDMLRRAQDKVERRGLVARQEPAGDGRVPARLSRTRRSTPWRRSSSSRWCRARRGADRVRPRAEARRRDRAGQPFRPGRRARSPGRGGRRAALLARSAGARTSRSPASRPGRAAAGLAEVVEVKPVFPGGFFKLMRIRKAAAARPAARAAVS